MGSIADMFREPRPTERPLRMLVYGESKTGKSHLVHTSVEVGPLFWQDSEGGADLYPAEYGHGFRVLSSKDPWKTIEAIDLANQMFQEGGPRPIVAIDSMSSVWYQQREVAEGMASGKGRIPFHVWGRAKRPLVKLYDMMHTTRCHVLITARAKMGYEVSNSGEPVETGLRPDVEKGLPYAMDLIVLTSVRDVSGEDLKPGDFVATVMGTRSPSVDGSVPEIPIGRTFYDPKLSDFLDAMVKGAEPKTIEDTTQEQVLAGLAGNQVPTNWADFKAWLEHNTEWEMEAAKAALKKSFGDNLNSNRLEDYYDFLRTRAPEAEHEPGE